MAWLKYDCKFFSENKMPGPAAPNESANDNDPNQQQWRISIYQETGSQPAGYPKTFKCTSEGFKLKMDGSDDNIFQSCIKTTSVEFGMIIEGADQEQIIADILSVATGNEDEFSVIIDKNTTDGTNASWETYWRGVLQGDLVSVQDVGINNVIQVNATDGLNQLKYKEWDFVNHGGNKSCMYIIKQCLRQIPLTANAYDANDEFIAHTPYYYCQAMGSSSTNIFSSSWRANTKRDPLSLAHINTEVFKTEEGRAWNYYHILEQILSAFQLRIYMTQIYDNAVNDRMAVWFLQQPMCLGGSGYSNLIFYHGNDLTTGEAINYRQTFNTRIVDPQTRTTGSLTTFEPALYSYKTIFEHKILQNMALGPLSFNSYTHYASSGSTSTQYIGTTANEFSVMLTESNSEPGGPGMLPDNYHSANQKLLLTGQVRYFPNKKLSWDFFEENSYTTSFFNGYPETCWVDQAVFLPLGLYFGSYSQIYEVQSFPFFQYYWLGDHRLGQLMGGPTWKGPNDGTSGSPGMAWWNTQPPAVYSYPDQYGNQVYPWGTDAGGSSFFYDTTPNLNLEQTYAFISPYYHYITGVMLSTGTSYTSFSNAWNGTSGYEDYGTGWQSFSIESPPLPIQYVQGNQGGWVGPPAGLADIRGIRLYYGIPRFSCKDNDNDIHFTCSFDWPNYQATQHEDRGMGFDYELSDVKVYIVGAGGDSDYFDYSIGYFTNQNGTPSESATQDPVVIIGDSPSEDTTNQAANPNEGTTLVYFGQFWIKQNDCDGNSWAGPSDQTLPQWFHIHESDYGWGPRLHKLRARQMVRFNYKLKQKLQLNFIDRTMLSSYHTDFDLSKFGFSAILHWNAGQTENDDWIGPHFGIQGGEFVAGDMSWKITAVEVDSYEYQNITDESYASNNSN